MEERLRVHEPRDANRTMVVTGDHSTMLNAYVEILKASAGSRLIGLLPYRRPRDHVINVTVPERIAVSADTLAEALAAA